MPYIILSIFIAAFFAIPLFFEKEDPIPTIEPIIIDLNKIAPNLEKEINEEVEVNEENLDITTTEEPPEETIQETQQIDRPPVEPTETIPTISFTQINELTRQALVNILCTTKNGSLFKPITGSGIIIDNRGIILTNAHVAQYFLLKDYLTPDFMNCIIRTDSPARPEYKAKLLYFPKAWLEENANNIVDQNPTGTGEYDFAFLLIDSPIQERKTLPDTFPEVEIDVTEQYFLPEDIPILIAGYPAGFLSGQIVQRDLYAVSTIASVEKLFTFASTTIDIFSTGGNLAAQKGSSGGAIMGNHNKLVGLISLSTNGDTTEERDLRAITLAHINRSLKEFTGEDIESYFTDNLTTKANLFSTTTAPTLSKLLTDVIER